MIASSRTQTTVLIVGGGPVGLTLAVQLQRFGVPYRLVEKNGGPSTATKAMAIHSRTLEIFREMGIADQVVEAGKKILKFRAQSQGKTILCYDFGLLDAAYPFLLSLPQPRTEALLLQRLEALGGRVEWGVEVSDLAQNEHGANAALVHPDRRREIVTAQWVVGCDGARSTVRRTLGLPFEGDSYHRYFMLTDVDVEWKGSRDEGAFFLGSQEGYVAVAPLDDNGRYRLFVEMPHDLPPEHERPSLDVATFQKLCEGRGQAMRLSNQSSMTAAAFQHRRVPRQQVGRIFLAGDSAHIGSPIGGQYMNMGIAEAHNLAWKLATVYAGTARPALLDSYDAERHPVAVEAEKTAHVLTKILTLRNRLLTQLRDTLFPIVGNLPKVRRKLPWMISGHRYRYRPSAVLEDARPRRTARKQAALGLSAGALAPDVELWRLRGEAPLRLLDLWQGRFALLLFAGRDASSPEATSLAHLAEAVQRRYPSVGAHLIVDALQAPPIAMSASVVLDADYRVHRRYGASGGEIVLVRPDGFVAFAGAQAGALLEYLDTRSCLTPSTSASARAEPSDKLGTDSAAA